jgi:ATP-dependent Clp protease ATP-binding subunit ClpA
MHQGNTISFKNTLIIMTSNLGSAEIFAQAAEEEDRGAVRERVMEHVRQVIFCR